MSNPKVRIQFSTAADLWRFKVSINALVIKIDTESLSLICECCADHIQVAKTEFNAIEVQTINLPS